MFQLATTQMSTTKGASVLSTTHGIFRGLQAHIVNIIQQLPESLPIKIRTGLVEAHQKLSVYYYKYDQSPFYTWAAHTFSLIIAVCVRCVSHYLVLDPRINYKVLLEDYQDDQDLVDYLESSVLDLRTHYQRHYQASTTHDSLAELNQLTQVTSSRALSSKNRSAVNFTARYSKKERLDRNELEEYFKVDQESWELCNPLEWWVGCHAQFPNLFQLACDILTIPGTSITSSNSCLGSNFTCQVLLLPLSASFPGGVTLSPYGVQVCNRRRFVC